MKAEENSALVESELEAERWNFHSTYPKASDAGLGWPSYLFMEKLRKNCDAAMRRRGQPVGRRVFAAATANEIREIKQKQRTKL